MQEPRFRARDALRDCLPEALRDNTFAAQLADEPATQRCLALLVEQLFRTQVPSATVVASSNGVPLEGLGNTVATEAGVGGAIESGGSNSSATAPAPSSNVSRIPLEVQENAPN